MISTMPFSAKYAWLGIVILVAACGRETETPRKHAEPTADFKVDVALSFSPVSGTTTPEALQSFTEATGTVAIAGQTLIAGATDRQGAKHVGLVFLPPMAEPGTAATFDWVAWFWTNTALKGNHFQLSVEWGALAAQTEWTRCQHINCWIADRGIAEVINVNPLEVRLNGIELAEMSSERSRPPLAARMRVTGTARWEAIRHPGSTR